MSETLEFKVAPHIVQDLGLNLYTELPRVLVEFVANAYDADADAVDISLDKDAIKAAREALRREHKAIKTNTGKEPNWRLAEATLPEDLTIVIEDGGHGMSRTDLDLKFLVAGRRRRHEEDGGRSELKRRPVMGRKGLGKLAGFGVARVVKVLSRKKGEADATEVTLDYEKLTEFKGGEKIPVPVRTVTGGGGLPATGGTRVTLARLVYEPTKSALETIANAIGDHFVMIRPEEFAIRLNGQIVPPTPRNYEFAYPVDAKLSHEELIEDSLDIEDSEPVRFKYRVRFTARGESLSAKERGVRVYASKRLASAPNLLDVSTNVHGFRNTEYMDAIVEADFIDADPRIDYIATDRHSLRWEVSPLAELHAYLTEKMMEGIREFQYFRDEKSPKEAKEDKWTQDLVAEYDFPTHRRKTAMKIAAILADSSEKGVKGKDYRTHLKVFCDGLSQGEILTKLSELAKTNHPGMPELVDQISRLTQREYSEAAQYVSGRLKGIEALSKLVVNVDFKAAKNEAELHELLRDNPWLLGTSFNQLLASDKPQQEVLVRLEKYLKVGEYVPGDYDPEAKDEVEVLGANRRPDLVFTMQSPDKQRILIVELKAPNTPLHLEHLTQLKGYLRDIKEWLKEEGFGNVRVKGLLVGSKAEPKSKAEPVRQLRYELDERSDSAEWDVIGLADLLERTKGEHIDLLEVFQEIADEED